MNASDLVRRLHQHRMWVNHGLLEAARRLTAEQLHEQFAIGQGSVWKTLTHLLGAEYLWLEALLGNEDPLLPGDVPGKMTGNQEGENPIASLDELDQRWKTLDQRWNDHLAQLRDDSLEDIVYKLRSGSTPPQRLGARRVDILLHVCTHAQYTTAQLVNMLRQLGQTEFPEVMLISLARQERA